jgi:hypothetical protein
VQLVTTPLSRSTFTDANLTQVESLGEEPHEALFFQEKRDMVDASDIMTGDDLIGTDVTKHADLGSNGAFEGLGTAGSDQVWGQAESTQVPDR